MFCRFCGKELEDDSVFCGNCGAPVGKEKAPVKKEQEVVEPFFVKEEPAPVREPFFAEEKPLPAVNPRMVGFGKALTGTILSFVGMVLFFIIFEIILWACCYDDYMAAFVLLLGTIALGVVSVVFGVKSIKTFKNAQGQKPIATLILGIISLAEGASCLLSCAIIFFPLVVLLG